MQLPTLDRRVLPNTGPTVRVNERAPQSGLGALAEGVQDAAVTVAQVDLDQQQARFRERVGEMGIVTARLENQWQERLRQASEAAPLGAPDFTANLLRDFDAEWGQAAAAFADSERLSQAMTANGLNLRGTLAAQAERFESGARQRRTTAQQTELIDLARVRVRSKPEEYESALAERQRHIGLSGLPAEAQEALTLSARQGLAAAAVETLVEQNPADAIRRLQAGPGESGSAAIEGLTPEGRERARNAAETRLRVLAAEERARQAEARAAAVARSAALKDYVADAQQQFALGFGLPPDYGEALGAIASLPDDDPRKRNLLRTDAVLTALDRSGFMALPPEAQAEQLTALESQLQEGAPSPEQIDLVKMARTVQGESARQAAQDPYQFALRRGVVRLPAETGDPMADMKARAAAGRQASAFFGRDVPGFTQSELNRLGENYLKGSVDDRLGLVAGLVETHGQQQASVVFEALDKQNFAGMGLAGALVMDDPEAARLVIKGQQSRRDGKGLVPKAADFAPVLAEQLGDAYGLGTSARQTAEQGILDAYAALSADAGDVSGDLDEGRMEQAIAAVTGGLVTHAGRTMPAPLRGVSQGQFSAWVAGLDAGDFAEVAGLEPARALAAWRADGWLEAIGPNQYAAVIEGPDGAGRYLLDQRGEPLTLGYDPGAARSTGSRAAEAFGLTPFGPLK